MGADRVLVACGGTGGHFYPGYVLGKTLRERGHETLFLLRTEDPAARTLAAEDLPFVEIDLRGMPRKAGLEWVKFAARLAGSLRRVRNILRDFRPRAVVGMGGYLTFPAVAAARWLGVPSMIHESNSVLGLANRACLRLVDKVALGLPLAEAPRWSVPFVLTGTPVRREFWRLPDPAESRRKLGLDPATATVLVFGGSQGAKSLNETVPAGLRRLAASARTGLQVLHLSGGAHADGVRAAYADAPLRAVVLPYLDRMDEAYAAADLVVCRAGASTLAELAAARRPALLVPYPFAAAGHQDANARVFERCGAARRMPDSALTEASLAEAVGDLLSSGPGPQAKLLEMARSYENLQLPDPRSSLSTLLLAVEDLMR